MKKTLTFVFLMMYIFVANTCLAASYSYIDPGDYYYINRWGENEYVVVVRKLGDGDVKVRNLSTGATSVVDASKLLTKSELDTQENVNTAVGVGAILCVLGGCLKDK